MKSPLWIPADFPLGFSLVLYLLWFFMLMRPSYSHSNWPVLSWGLSCHPGGMALYIRSESEREVREERQEVRLSTRNHQKNKNEQRRSQEVRVSLSWSAAGRLSQLRPLTPLTPLQVHVFIHICLCLCSSDRVLL